MMHGFLPTAVCLLQPLSQQYRLSLRWSLTEAKSKRCNNYILLCVHWDSFRVTKVDT